LTLHSTPKQTWTFHRAGTVDQVVIADGRDLDRLASLDMKLWMALACPTHGLEIDQRTLELIDTDGDGRIRPPEILGAIDWARHVFRDLDDMFKSDDAVSFESIRADTPSGREMQAAATRVMAELGRSDAREIRLADVVEIQQTLSERSLNGDGVIPCDSAEDERTRAVIADAMAVVGSTPDRSGKPGIDRGRLDEFFDRVRAYAAWLEKEAAARTLGDETPRAAQALSLVRAKIDDYFVRCRLAAFDGRIASSLNGTDEQIAEFAGSVLAPEDNRVAALPLAHVNAGSPLPLGAINPAWTERIGAFVEATVKPIFAGPRSELSEQEWAAVTERFVRYDEWLASRPADDAIGSLGRDRIAALAHGSDYAAISDLIDRDLALAAVIGPIQAVEKMIRLRRDFATLLRNFVNFSDFYGKRGSMFQVGTLYIDGRSCELCLPVQDVAKHVTLATLSNTYLLYCECTRNKDTKKRTIVAAVTAGDVDNLMVGRNGVFYDRRGDDWDATVTKIVENPISVRQAFWAPYKRFVRFVQEQLSKRAAASDAEATKHIGDGVPGIGSAIDAKAPMGADASTPANPKKIDVGTVAAIGVAVGGIATFFSSIIATVLGLGMWMPLGVVALALAISGPSMFIAYLKLHQRNIGPLLDASGWAVNAFARVNVPFGSALTSVATLPPGAVRTLKDPFAEKRTPWKTYLLLAILLALLVAWMFGKFDGLLPDRGRPDGLFRGFSSAAPTP